LLDGGGTHIITVAAFPHPPEPWGCHEVKLKNEFSGLAFQDATGLAFLRSEVTFTVFCFREPEPRIHSG